MNMIKKIALGLSTIAMSSAFVACTDNGGGSVSDITITQSGAGKWLVDGVVMADNNIFDVKYSLKTDKGVAVVGAVYANTVKQVNPDTSKALLEVNLGKGVGTVPGLETEIYQSNMAGACGTLTLSVVAFVEGAGVTGSANGDVVELEAVTGTFEVACGVPGDTTDIEEVIPDFDLGAALVDATIDLGGAKSTLASALDLDLGVAYTSALLTATVKPTIDVVFSGTKIMTTSGTAEAGYMTKTFKGFENGAFFVKVSAADADKATTVEEMMELFSEDVLVQSDVKNGDAFLVVTEQGAVVLVMVTALDSATQKITLKYAKEGAAAK